jgi:hypothetical protein
MALKQQNQNQKSRKAKKMVDLCRCAQARRSSEFAHDDILDDLMLPVLDGLAGLLAGHVAPPVFGHQGPVLLAHNQGRDARYS